MNYDLVLKNIAKHISLSPEEENYFTSLLETKKVKKREFLIREGDFPVHSWFIVKGCLRYYEIDKNGIIHNSYIAVEEWWISDIAAFIMQTSSSSFIDALEDSEVLVLSKHNIDKL